MASQPDLAAYALSIAETARTRDTSDRERIQRENAALFAWRQQFVDMGESSYLTDLRTGRKWGKDAETRAREAGGIGIAVQASATPRPGKLLRERR